MLLPAVPAPASAQSSPLPGPQEEFALKAAFVYNFARFTTWPEDSFTDADGEITLCVYAAPEDSREARERNQDILEAFETLSGRRIGERLLRVVPWNPAQVEVPCHILYLPGDREQSIIDIPNLRSSLPVLTIGEGLDFATGGGMIGFYILEDRLRFAINKTAVDDRRLTLSSQLLKLAQIIQ